MHTYLYLLGLLLPACQLLAGIDEKTATSPPPVAIVVGAGGTQALLGGHGGLSANNGGAGGKAGTAGSGGLPAGSGSGGLAGSSGGLTGGAGGTPPSSGQAGSAGTLAAGMGGAAAGTTSAGGTDTTGGAGTAGRGAAGSGEAGSGGEAGRVSDGGLNTDGGTDGGAPVLPPDVIYTDGPVQGGTGWGESYFTVRATEFCDTSCVPALLLILETDLDIVECASFRFYCGKDVEAQPLTTTEKSTDSSPVAIYQKSQFVYSQYMTCNGSGLNLLLVYGKTPVIQSTTCTDFILSWG